MKNSPRLRTGQDADRKGGGPRYVLLILIGLLQASGSLAQTKAPSTNAGVHVPFVGCAEDGQAGPLEAPKQADPVVRIRAAAAARLAYYQAERSPGVLAPRGWYCFAAYGSNGGQLFVSPHPYTTVDFFSNSWRGFDGPAIAASDSASDTSGRYKVAQVIARVFPAHKAFVQSVIDMHVGVEEGDFSFGPFPKDRLTYRGKDVVEYQTPANTEGLGTMSWLIRNDSPIDGVELLDAGLNLSSLAMRLPPDMNDLVPVIIRQLERESRPPAPSKTAH